MSPALGSSAVRLSARRSAILRSTTARLAATLARVFGGVPDLPSFGSLGMELRLALRFVLSLALCFALLPVFAVDAETQPAPAAGSSSSVSAESGRDTALRLTQSQGRCEGAILDWVLANSGALKGETLRGEFRVAYTITPAEGWWERTTGGRLAWHDAPANQLHLRVFVADAADGRLEPAFSVAAAVVDMNGNEQALPISFGWYPLINAHGGNVAVADGAYRLRVRIAVPEPHDPQPVLTEEEIAQGEGLARTVVAEFPPVTIKQSEVMLLPIATEAAVAKEAELLKPCNVALRASITALWQQSASGEEKASGDYFVAYALEPASSAVLARLRRKRPLDFGRENARLQVLVRDSRTGRLIPFLAPQSTLETPGELNDKGSLLPMRHPWIDLYGRYLRLERKASYRLRVMLEPPDFRRWGRHSERFALPAELGFEEVTLKTAGSKPEEQRAGKSRPESGTNR